MRRTNRLETHLRRWLIAEHGGEERTAVRALDTLLQGIPEPMLSRDFTERVMSRWRAVSAPPRLERAAIGLVLASAMALAGSGIWVPAATIGFDGAAVASVLAALWTVLGEIAATLWRSVSVISELGRATKLVWGTPFGMMVVATLLGLALVSWQLLYHFLQQRRFVHVQT